MPKYSIDIYTKQIESNLQKWKTRSRFMKTSGHTFYVNIKSAFEKLDEHLPREALESLGRDIGNTLFISIKTLTEGLEAKLDEIQANCTECCSMLKQDIDGVGSARPPKKSRRTIKRKPARACTGTTVRDFIMDEAEEVSEGKL